MELVKGIPLTQFCDEHKLPVLDRLNLFMQVCSAVQHAHQKGIIHRDLKPSNILVESHDGRPVPKAIDFGLAKATSPGAPGLTEHTLFTALGQVAGTPLYMAKWSSLGGHVGKVRAAGALLVPPGEWMRSAALNSRSCMMKAILSSSTRLRDLIAF